MNKLKIEKKIRRKLSRVKPCPFCGRIPEIKAYCDSDFSAHGSWGHYVVRERCCSVTQMGQTELFFTQNWKGPKYKQWWSMLCRLIDDWNRRNDT